LGASAVAKSISGRTGETTISGFLGLAETEDCYPCGPN